MMGPPLGTGIIDGADKIGLKGCTEPAFNGFPRREQVAQADAGKIVHQGSAQQGCRRAHRRNAGHNIEGHTAHKTPAFQNLEGQTCQCIDAGVARTDKGRGLA